MPQVEVVDAIGKAFDNLYNWSPQLFDYWISELYDDNENEIWEKWNEDNLALMEKDVMSVVGDMIDQERAELIGN